MKDRKVVRTHPVHSIHQSNSNQYIIMSTQAWFEIVNTGASWDTVSLKGIEHGGDESAVEKKD